MEREFYRSGNTAEKFLRSLKENMAAVIYDCETTGLSPEKNHVIQISARKCFVCEDGFEEMESRAWYINPGYALPEKIVELTGITDDFLAGMPREAEVIHEIVGFFKDMTVVGYNNLQFDDPFMDAMYTRNGLVFAPQGSIDIYKVVKAVILPGETVNYKLGSVTKYLGLADEITQFHNAEGDTMATLLVANGCIGRCREKCRKSAQRLIRSKVVRIARWENPRNQRQKRIYVETEDTTLYFDCLSHVWSTKEISDMISRYDMEYVTLQVMKATNCHSEADLARWKGSIQISKK